MKSFKNTDSEFKQLLFKNPDSEFELLINNLLDKIDEIQYNPPTKSLKGYALRKFDNADYKYYTIFSINLVQKTPNDNIPKEFPLKREFLRNSEITLFIPNESKMLINKNLIELDPEWPNNFSSRRGGHITINKDGLTITSEIVSNSNIRNKLKKGGTYNFGILPNINLVLTSKMYALEFMYKTQYLEEEKKRKKELEKRQKEKMILIVSITASSIVVIGIIIGVFFFLKNKQKKK